MRVLVNFQLSGDAWVIHCLAEDARTPISRSIRTRKQSTLLRLLVACGATFACMQKVEEDINSWSRGSVWLDVPEDRKYLLWIHT
jgi:hypothetical protein